MSGMPLIRMCLEDNLWIAQPECPKCDYGFLVEVGSPSREFVKDNAITLLIDHLNHEHGICCSRKSIRCTYEYEH